MNCNISIGKKKRKEKGEEDGEGEKDATKSRRTHIYGGPLNYCSYLQVRDKFEKTDDRKASLPGSRLMPREACGGGGGPVTDFARKVKSALNIPKASIPDIISILGQIYFQFQFRIGRLHQL